MKLRVLVVDDSLLYRRLISTTLSSIPDVEVVGSAYNGGTALAKISELNPDLITLDMEMPVKSGLEVLKELNQNNWKGGVVVISSYTESSFGYAFSALELGAFEIVPKPSGDSPEANQNELREILTKTLQAFRNRQTAAPKSSGLTIDPPPAKPETKPVQPSATIPGTKLPKPLFTIPKPDFILIGASTGGPVAITRLLSQLPGDIDVPIFIVQHMPPYFTDYLAKNLSKKSNLPFKEAENGEIAKPNIGFIAPGGKHLGIAKAPSNQILLKLSDAPPENCCRPAVDYLFRSAANFFPGKGLAVILTGMGNDGLLGVKLLKRHGCYVFAQSSETCSVFGMPKAIVDANLADAILAPEEIGIRIKQILMKIPA